MVLKPAKLQLALRGFSLYMWLHSSHQPNNYCGRRKQRLGRELLPARASAQKGEFWYKTGWYTPTLLFSLMFSLNVNNGLAAFSVTVMDLFSATWLQPLDLSWGEFNDMILRISGQQWQNLLASSWAARLSSTCLLFLVTNMNISARHVIMSYCHCFAQPHQTSITTLDLLHRTSTCSQVYSMWLLSYCQLFTLRCHFVRWKHSSLWLFTQSQFPYSKTTNTSTSANRQDT